MDPNQLSKFFPRNFEWTTEAAMACEELYLSAADLAECLQRLLPESQKKFDLHMGLLQIVREAKFALRLDGPSRTTPMIVVKQ